MRKRAIILFVLLAVVAAGIAAYVLLRRNTPPAAVRLLPAADAYLYFDIATVRRAAALGDLPKVDLEADYEDFVRQTGFNLEKDLDEAAFALQRPAGPSNPQEPEWRNTGVFVASFDRAKLEAYFQKTGSGSEKYRDTTIYAIPLPGRTVRVAILDKRTVAATNTDGPYVIQGIIDRHAQSSSGTPDLIHSYYENIPWGSLAWAVARPPASTQGGNARLELPGGLGIYLPAETVVVASLRYLGSVDFRAQAFATSEDAARRISDQLSAFLALFRALQSAQAQGNDADVRGFFDSIKVTLDGKRAEMQATVPAGFVKKLVANAPAQGIEANPGEPQSSEGVRQEQSARSKRFPGFSVNVKLSGRATKKLVESKETIIVAGYVTGSPRKGALKQYVDEHMGEVGVGKIQAEIAPGASAKFQEVRVDGDALAQVDQKGPRLLINVYSGRKSSSDNLLDCGIYEGSLKVVKGKNITINCKLIGE